MSGSLSLTLIFEISFPHHLQLGFGRLDSANFEWLSRIQSFSWGLHEHCSWNIGSHWFIQSALQCLVHKFRNRFISQALIELFCQLIANIVLDSFFLLKLRFLTFHLNHFIPVLKFGCSIQIVILFWIWLYQVLLSCCQWHRLFLFILKKLFNMTQSLLLLVLR
jgi:hypothetical protein